MAVVINDFEVVREPANTPPTPPVTSGSAERAKELPDFRKQERFCRERAERVRAH